MMLRKQIHLLIILAVAQFVSVSLAQACSIAPEPLNWIDERISVANDCSFKNAGEDYYGFMFGNKARDLGGGRISQNITDGAFCTSNESIIVVNCNNSTLASIAGTFPTEPMDYGTGPSKNLELVTKPLGPISIDSKSIPEQLVNQALGYGFEAKPEIFYRWKSMKRINKFDPMCGCKLFYPNSRGAKS